MNSSCPLGEDCVPGVSQFGHETEETDRATLWWLRVGWSLVFVANLPVPLLCGLALTGWGGRLGMLAAIGVLYIGGWESCRSYRRLASVIIAGGTLVALAQGYPLGHICAGTISIGISRGLKLVSYGENISGALGGCVVTLLTGEILLAAALVAGMMIALLYRIAELLPCRPPRETEGRRPEVPDLRYEPLRPARSRAAVRE